MYQKQTLPKAPIKYNYDSCKLLVFACPAGFIYLCQELNISVCIFIIVIDASLLDITLPHRKESNQTELIS